MTREAFSYSSSIYAAFLNEFPKGKHDSTNYILGLLEWVIDFYEASNWATRCEFVKFLRKLTYCFKLLISWFLIRSTSLSFAFKFTLSLSNLLFYSWDLTMQTCFYWCNSCTLPSRTLIFRRSWSVLGYCTITWEAWFLMASSPWIDNGLETTTRLSGELWMIVVRLGDLFSLITTCSMLRTGCWKKFGDVLEWTGIYNFAKFGWGVICIELLRISVYLRGSFYLEVLIDWTRVCWTVCLNLSGLLLLPRWIMRSFLLIEIENDQQINNI